MVSPSRQRHRILIRAGAILVGVLLTLPAVKRVTRPSLPPEIEAALLPVTKPTVVNLGHKGAAPSSLGRIAEQQGVAIIESPLESALSEYGRLSGHSIVRQPDLPSRTINFRGQARPQVLVQQLAMTLHDQGVRLVETSDGRIAAVALDVRLQYGSFAGSVGSYAALATGLALLTAGVLLGRRPSGPVPSPMISSLLP